MVETLDQVGPTKNLGRPARLETEILLARVEPDCTTEPDGPLRALKQTLLEFTNSINGFINLSYLWS